MHVISKEMKRWQRWFVVHVQRVCACQFIVFSKPKKKRLDFHNVPEECPPLPDFPSSLLEENKRTELPRELPVDVVSQAISTINATNDEDEDGELRVIGVALLIVI